MMKSPNPDRTGLSRRSAVVRGGSRRGGPARDVAGTCRNTRCPRRRPGQDHRDPGRLRLVRRRGGRAGARRPPGAGRRRHGLPDDLHLRPRAGGPPGAGAAVPRPRRPRVGRGLVPRRQLRPAAREFYRDTVLKDTRATDHGDLDIVEAVLPAAKKRGLKLVCSVEDVWRPSVPGFDRVAEVDVQGRKAGTLCLMNPDVRHFWTGAGHRSLLVLRDRWHPLLQRAQRPAAQRHRLEPRAADRLLAHDVLLRAPPEGREGARPRLRACTAGVPASSTRS